MKNTAKPFEMSVVQNTAVGVDMADGLAFHPIFWKIRMAKNTRKHFFQLCELIDINSGMLVQKFSDGRTVPLSKGQLLVFFHDNRISDSLDELVAYGVFAEITVCRTKFYVANPYVVSRGLVANSYLFCFFNATTLNRNDNYNAFFDLKNQESIKKLWEELDVK